MPNRSLMCARLWDDLGLEGIRLEINSLGQSDERARHRAELLAYLERHHDQLDADARRRLHSNPLRILDTKNPAMQALVEAAPKLIDYLGEESLKHFEGVQQLLKDAAIPYRINPRLVRGLDYYNLTVFEWVTDQLGAQGTVCAGGRYDGLIAQLGGKPAPACGFAMGIERLLALWQDQGHRHLHPGARCLSRASGRSCRTLCLSRRRSPAQCGVRDSPALRRRQLQVADEEGRRFGRADCRDSRR